MSKSKYFTVIDDMVWSYSRLETFNTCPYKFFLKYISEEEDKPQFYTSYGSFIHKLIEQYYNDEISKDNLWVEFVTKFKDSVKGEIPSEEIVKKYIQLGVDYFKNFQPFDFKPIAVEEMIEFKIDDINFIGFVDFVGEKDGEFYIVDNKSRDLKQRRKRKKPIQRISCSFELCKISVREKNQMLISIPPGCISSQNSFFICSFFLFF